MALAFLVGMLFLIWQLSKNTELTKAITKEFSSAGSLPKLVSEIREDQKKSNIERIAHGERLAVVESDLAMVKADLHKLGCQNAPTCGNRV